MEIEFWAVDAAALAIDQAKTAESALLDDLVFCKRHQLSPTGIPCRIENGRLVAASKHLDVQAAKLADAKVAAVFQCGLSEKEREQLRSLGAEQIAVADIEAGIRSRFARQYLGFSSALTADQVDEVDALMKHHLGEDYIASHWSADRRMVFIDIVRSSACRRRFGFFLQSLESTYPARSYQGREFPRMPPERGDQ